jgi:hypothetical protein
LDELINATFNNLIVEKELAEKGGGRRFEFDSERIF